MPVETFHETREPAKDHQRTFEKDVSGLWNRFPDWTEGPECPSYKIFDGRLVFRTLGNDESLPRLDHVGVG